MINRFKRISKRIERVANEINNIESISFKQSLKDTKNDVLEIEKEIEEILSSKIAQLHSDVLLSKTYHRAGEIISSVNTLKLDVEEITKISIEERRALLNIRDSIATTIINLDNFYKTKLNPKFNYHGITHVMLNKRMNELRQSWKIINELAQKLI